MKNHPLVRYLASLELAVFTLLGLSAVLAYATVLEARYGMRAAHVMVYGTWWFYVLLFFLSLNVLFAVLVRYPWKRYQTGFVITHAGILVILLGSWITARFGVDGALPVVEGSSDRSVILSDLHLTLTDTQGGMKQVYPLREFGRVKHDLGLVLELPGDERILVEQFYPRVTESIRWIASEIPGVGIPALKVELASPRLVVDQWLSADHPDLGGEKDLGPARLKIKRLWSAEQTKQFLTLKKRVGKASAQYGVVQVLYRGRSIPVDVQSALGKWKRAGSTSFEVKIDRYLPYAVVENKKLVTRSKEPRNPAVELSVRNPFGVTEKHTLFALFPDFATKHQPKDQNAKQTEPLSIELKYEGPTPNRNISGRQHAATLAGQGELEFAIDSTGKAYYRIFNSAGLRTGVGQVEPNVDVPTGWMDLRFRILEKIPYAVQSEEPVNVDVISGSQTNFLSAIKFRIETGHESDSSAQWLVEGGVKDLMLAGRRFQFSLDKQSLDLPFEIFLNRFNIGMDPGTTRAASYESEVRVVGSSARDPAQTTVISMNEPLKYGGYTFYQASYQMREGEKPVSVFSVNRDPGRWVKYFGCIVMIFGILVMFYMNPHYFDKILGGARSEG